MKMSAGQHRPAIFVDRVDREIVAGWAWYPSAPERHVRLMLECEGQPIGEFAADNFRADLNQSSIGDGDHAFEISVPLYLRFGAAIDLTLKEAETGRILANLSLPPAHELVDELLPRLLKSLGRELDDGGHHVAPKHLQALLPVMDRLWQACSESPPPDSALAREIARCHSVYGRTELPCSSDPAVSIVMPVHNKFPLTWRCLTSLANLADTVPFEVIVVDDASSDETLLLPILAPGVRLYRLAQNLGFVHSCNAGASLARAPFVHFLNNDTEVLDGALAMLVRLLQEEPACAIVGSRLLNIDGTLQEAGGVVFRFGDAANCGRGLDAEDPRYLYRRDADYVSGASLMIRREVFIALGGFDEMYAPGYYEDTDLCFRARQAGWTVRYQPRSAVLHLEGGTAGRDLTGGMKRRQVVNARRFFERWRGALSHHAVSFSKGETEKDRHASFRVLFLDANLPAANSDAGSMAAMSHIRLIQAMGGKVTLMASTHLGLQGEDGARLQDRGVEVLHHPHVWSVEEVLRRRGDEFSVIYIHRLEVAARHLITCRELAPQARIIYNVADLHFLRAEREAGALGKALPSGHRDMRAQELRLIGLADAAIVHSEAEAALLSEQGLRNVAVVPWTYEAPAAPGHIGRSGLLFVGGWRHGPNPDGIKWFMSEIWPTLRSVHTSLTLDLIGSHMPQDIIALGLEPGVRVHGHVQDLDTFYTSARLAIAPLRYGAGLKGKVLEALAKGVPCVGTHIAFEGIAVAAAGRLIAGEAKGFIDRCLVLLRNDTAWRKAQAAGLSYARDTLSDAVVGLQLQKVLLAPHSSINSNSNPNKSKTI